VPLPLPPHEVQAVVAGPEITDDLFLKVGASAIPFILQTLEGNGISFDEIRTMLDWGCGCGRILRHWHNAESVTVHGCDTNAELVAWCQKNLPDAPVRLNEPMPPLPYDGSSFDFAYGLSVFTHLTEPAHYAWRDEIHRVLKPGGVFLFTTHGDAEHFIAALDDDMLKQFRNEELVVRVRDVEGTEFVAAWHHPSWVTANLLDGFDLLAYEPRGAECCGRQDSWFVQKR
jgi:SAM-dependent methyltransferase